MTVTIKSHYENEKFKRSISWTDLYEKLLILKEERNEHPNRKNRV